MLAQWQRLGFEQQKMQIRTEGAAYHTSLH